MKKLTLIFVLLISIANICNAQNDSTVRAIKAQMILNRLPAILKLTADQKAGITTVYLAHIKSIDSLTAITSPGGEGVAAKFTEIRAKTDTSILALLAEAQELVYEAFVELVGVRAYGEDTSQ